MTPQESRPVRVKADLDQLVARRATLRWLSRLALVACAVGAVIGLRLLFRGASVACSGSGGGVCRRHPHAGEGLMVLLLSLVLAVLVIFAQLAVSLLLEARARELGAGAGRTG